MRRNSSFIVRSNAQSSSGAVVSGLRPHSRAVVGKPKRNAIGLALVACRLELVIAPQQRDRSSHRLEVVAPAAGSAAVYPQVGMALAQLVPEGEMTCHMLVLGHADA